MTLFRFVLAICVVVSLGSAVSACGVWRGDSNVSTDVGEGAMGKGPGLITGRSGGVIIYQR